MTRTHDVFSPGSDRLRSQGIRCLRLANYLGYARSSPYFNASPFNPNTPGNQGSAKQRYFNEPGTHNFGIALRRLTKPTETKSLELRFETFNTFNRAQFYPNGSVDGNINSPTFGDVLKSAPPRIGQIALKLSF